MAAKKPAKGSKLYIIGDPNAASHLRMMKACEAAATKALLKVLPPPKHVPTISEDSDDVDVCILKDVDPVKSYQEHLQAMPEDAYDDDDEGGGGGQRVQCA